MKTIHLIQNRKELLADTITPISIYLTVRDRFAHSFLLESSDYHGANNSTSFICFDPIMSFKVHAGNISIKGPGINYKKNVSENSEVVNMLDELLRSINYQAESTSLGLFGHTNFEGVQYFENIEFERSPGSIPELHYFLFRYVVKVDHHNNSLEINEFLQPDEPSKINSIEQLIRSSSGINYGFTAIENSASNLTNEEFLDLVSKAKKHCQRGDVFQLVLSRKFYQEFKGDEFNVYRALRSINPSPYLFYFDFGSYKLFGSSPEAQLKVEKGNAIINPIAGTYKRTGNDSEDEKLAMKLSNDLKETAEHNMLVDLARSDLSRNGTDVEVSTYKEVQFFSHVIHLVSNVQARIEQEKSLRVYADSFPAGTLSGAPKYKAMQLINQYEKEPRGFYGGAIGFLGVDGSINHAITIRSFMSKDNKLEYQAGAGIVVSSEEESELQEVENKVGALRRAIELAETI